MECKSKSVIVFSGRKIEGVTNLGDDSLNGGKGFLYLMNPEVAEMFEQRGVVTDKGRLAVILQ